MTGRAGMQSFHLPSLDGVRAFAALTVFLSHAGAGRFIPGAFGVTVFFFLSGYLITTLMRREIEESGRLDFRAFYQRRAYRILPPLYLVLAVIFVVTEIMHFSDYTTTGGVLSLLLQYSNYYLLDHHGSELLPTTGTYWSLAVEEHFYLVFPLLFVWIARRGSGARTAAVFFFICLAVLLWRCVLIYFLNAPSDRTYLATDTRFDSILFGCIMGVWMNPALDRDPFPSKAAKLLALAVGVALLAASFMVRDEDFRDTWRYSMQGLGLFPLFWLAVRHPEWPIFRPLNTRTARFLGAISYTFYLSHLLWISVSRRTLPGQPELLRGTIALILTIAFSYLVYRTVEQPLARMRKRLHGGVAPVAPSIVKKGQV
ncbi:acyltransferase [Massilia sp. METH4]|uniref:acyltransferase family protein n=1 Tax=Massilia sp. METH4 TaxID=3123041 RepID=UPI0030D0BFDF